MPTVVGVPQKQRLGLANPVTVQCISKLLTSGVSLGLDRGAS